ncbi:hypothetical protein Glove_261g92 [Diversispora epigaea]|uniref:Uncharacterized protein n=1 Tax=Diversispora epigaea TaxID=1348612 RepID=A0A397I6M5_9GLOM|nr:hypothetical protein Glove_261g92 [Diversispora epigaea]
MSNFNITTFLDKKDRTLPKPFNIRPGFDKRLFDNLSTIKHNETAVQWSLRVRVPLQNLLNAGKFSVYHRYVLFSSYGQGKFVNSDYRRLRIHKSHMAICFSCWNIRKLFGT